MQISRHAYLIRPISLFFPNKESNPQARAPHTLPLSPMLCKPLLGRDSRSCRIHTEHAFGGRCYISILGNIVPICRTQWHAKKHMKCECIYIFLISHPLRIHSSYKIPVSYFFLRFPDGLEYVWSAALRASGYWKVRHQKCGDQCGGKCRRTLVTTPPAPAEARCQCKYSK